MLPTEVEDGEGQLGDLRWIYAGKQRAKMWDTDCILNAL